MKMSLANLTTYRDLLTCLWTMTEKELDQEIMVLSPNPSGEVVRLEPVIAIGTVSEMDEEVVNYSQEQVVLLRDSSPFTKDGQYALHYMDEESSLLEGDS